MGNVTAKTTGEIASFMSPSVTNIKSLKVHFSPKQLDEGDPSPENVREIVGWDGVEVNGCGKNLFDKSQSIDNYRLKTDGTNYSATGYYISPFIPVKTGQLYIKNSPSIDAYHRFCTYTTNGPKAFVRRIDNINHVTIESNETYIRFCGEITEKDTAQVELGSTATSYEPYQENNISTNWTKNIKQWTYTDTTIDDSYSSNNFNGYGNGRWDNVITDIPSEWFGKELVYSAYIERSSSPLNEYDDVRVWCYGDSTTLFDAKSAQRIYTAEENRRSWVTFTIPEGTTKIGLGLYLSKGSRAYNPQLEYGSEPTEYQPYVGTIYGGYVDLISGELVGNWIKRDLSEMSTINAPNTSSNEPWNHRFLIENWDYNNSGWEKVNGRKNFIIDNIANDENGRTNFTAVGIDNSPIIYIYDNTISTVEEFKTKYSEHYVCYETKFPITHQLTSTQLSSFIGQNNFWSNADYVEIEYELKETEDIQKARKKIILNQPHIESVKDDLVNFNTDLRAPLKECKVYFEPIQEGEGDPSPDNVRNITGWDGIEVTQTNQNLICADDPNNMADFYKLTGTKVLLYDETEQAYYTDPNTNGAAYRKSDNYDFVSFVAPSDMTVTFSCKCKKLSGSDSQYRFRVYKITELPPSKSSNSMTSTLIKTFGNKDHPYDEWCNVTVTTTLEKGQGLQLLMYSWVMWKDISITIGESANSYIEGKEQQYSVTWADDIGTVYGGYVDLVKGELVAEYESISDTWGNWGTLYDQGDGTELRYKKFTNNIIGGSAGSNSSYCNIAKYKYSKTDGTIHFYNVTTSNNCRIYLPSGTDTSLQIQAVAKLAEPIHYQLTPQQLLTLKGTNNIWSNSNGKTEVKFWTH